MKKEMFEHEITILKDTFSRLLRRNATTNLKKIINKTHPADLAIIFRYFTENEQIQVFKLIEKGTQAIEFLTELDETLVEKLLNLEDSTRIANLIKDASANDQSYILGLLNKSQAKSIIELLKTEEQEEIEELMGYPDDSAGTLMTTDVFTLFQETSCKMALKTLQDQKDAEMVFYLYITDDENCLVGIASLRALATTSPNTPLKDIMVKQIHSVRPETDQEEVAQIVAQYNYLAVPVLDLQNHLLGIVTVDDVVDVIREEATEDFLKMAGAGEDREILLKSSWENAKARIPWLFASWIGGVLAATIIGYFEHMLTSIIALAAFIPVIIGMGGNIGTQSSTIIVRGIATGRIKLGNELKVLIKEIQVGFILGILYGFLLGLFANYNFIQADPFLGFVVGLSICCSMIIAAAVGAFTPLILRKLDIDPAIATGPFVTTSVDILGVLLYFIIAGKFLNM